MAAETPILSAASTLRKPHMTNPFSAITKSSGAGLSGKSTRNPIQFLPSTLKLLMLIIANTFKLPTIS
jgi:hypothetical protein